MKSQRKKILIVEEDEDYQFLLREFLEQTGFLIIEADRSGRAVELALAEHPDLIVIDLSFSGNQGMQVIEQIRQNPQSSEIPILASSDFGELGISLFLNIDSFGSGRIEYITKPYSLAGMAQQIEMIFSGRKKARSL